MHRDERPCRDKGGLRRYSTAALALLTLMLMPAAARAQAQWTTDASGNVNTASGVNNVGVGAVGAGGPAEKLTVAGSVAIKGTSAYAGSQLIMSNDDTNGPWIAAHTDRAGLSTANFAAPRLNIQANGLFFQFSPATAAGVARTWATKMTISGTNGNVGIGTSTPGAPLDVRGSIALDGTVPAAHAATNYSSLWLKNNVALISEVYPGYSVISLGANYQRSTTGWTNVDTSLPAWSFSMGAGPGYDQFQLVRSPSGGYTPTYLLVINSSGGVGIGAASPGAGLDVQTPVTAVTTAPANGVRLQQTITSAFNNGVQNGLYINPTFNDGAAVGNTHNALATGAGNVGIGTTATRAGLDVQNEGVAFGGVSYGTRFQQTLLSAGNNAVSTAVMINPTFSDGQAVGVKHNGLVVASGNVGVGTSTPQATLDVVGSINASTTINAAGAITGGSIQAKYQDVAEWVPSTQRLAAGTVVVLDSSKTNHVLASSESYDTKVAGVVSERPGIALGEGGEGKTLVATTGRVKVKVDATRAPIKVGDLLVTSDVEGTAMRSEPFEIGGRRMHAPGTIIGKALEPLASGVGEILVLLSLQ